MSRSAARGRPRAVGVRCLKIAAARTLRTSTAARRVVQFVGEGGEGRYLPDGPLHRGEGGRVVETGQADHLQGDDRGVHVLKPKHSAFFSTTLDTLLKYLGTRTLVIGGFAADICVLFTANDAYMRDLRIVVAADGVASNEAGDRDAALALMRRVLKASTPPAAAIDFATLATAGD